MILKYSKKDENNICHEAAKILKRGGIIAYPTDTLYGLGCSATNKKAVARLRKIKKNKQPFSILVSSFVMANKYVSLSALARKKLPGHYTLILPAKKKLPVSKNSIGLRFPRHWSTKISRYFGKPITSTSVNLHGKKPLTTASGIKKAFPKLDLYIDAGPLRNEPSKIFSLEGKQLR